MSSSRSPMSGDEASSPDIGPKSRSTTTFAPSVAAPLTRGSARGEGVNRPGRRQEDDVNLVVTTVGVSENQRAELRLTPDVGLSKGGGKPGQGYPLIFSQEASPAKTCPSQDDAPVSPGNGPACSSSSPGSQMSFDLDGSSSRTSWDCSPPRKGRTSRSSSARWPSSGTASAGGFSTLDSSEFPNGAVECSLSDILEEAVDPRYALSARAAAGILRRAERRGRKIPPDLEAALRALSAAKEPATTGRPSS